MQQAPGEDAASTRSMLKNIISDKHQDVMARFGALIGMGLLEAGV